MVKLFNYKIELILIYFSYFIPMVHFLLDNGREIYSFYKIIILMLALLVLVVLVKGVLLNDYVILRRIFWGHLFCLSLPIAIYYFAFERQGSLYDISVVLWLFVVNIILFRALLDAGVKKERKNHDE